MANHSYAFADNNAISDIFKFQRLFLMAMAQWPLHTPKSHWIIKALARSYEVFMVILPLHIALFHVKSIVDRWENGLDDISDFVTSTIIYSFCCFAMVFFIAYSERLKKLVDFMNENFRLRSATATTYISIEQSYKKAKFYALSWIAACVAGTIFWSLYPLMNQERTLPLHCWYPFDEKQPIVYEILYILQFFAQIQIGVVFANGSAVYIVLIILICGQYDILFCSFKNVLDTSKYLDGGDLSESRQSKTNIDEYDEVGQYYCSKEVKGVLPARKTGKNQCGKFNSDRSLKQALKDCVQHHHAILNVCQATENFFNPYCLIKSLQITFQLCFLLYLSANQTIRSVYRDLMLVQYLSLTCIELVLFTYFGEVLRIQSLRVGESLMRSRWFERCVAIRKEILIILPNALRPVSLTSGKFYPMDIQRLRSVATAAFSFFTLLQNMKNKNRE